MFARLPIHPGEIYGRLTAIEVSGRSGRGHVMWRCRCSCGTEANVRASRLTTGNAVSCGCARMPAPLRFKSTKYAKYGDEKRSPEFCAWRHMLDRTTRPTHPYFKDYGGRGISVCHEWQDFWVFLSDMGRRPSKMHSLDRINNDGNYEPRNCRWATIHEQNLNRKRRSCAMHQNVCQCCGKRIPLGLVYCGNTCREIASGKLRPVSIAEVLGAKR
jgi:hypothetical protein